MTAGNDLSVIRIRDWLDATRSLDVSTGLTVDEAMARAEVHWAQIQNGDGGILAALCRPEGVDELYAICRVIGREEARLSGSLARLGHVADLYESVGNMSWADDKFGEKLELLARIAYLAWLIARRTGSVVEIEAWERRATEQALTQSPVREFLGLLLEERSEELDQRFLGDTAVLLAALASLRSMTESAPLPCLEQAALLYSWVSRSAHVFESRDEMLQFAAELALIAAVTSKHCGRYSDCESWLGRIEVASRDLAGREHLTARAAFIRLALMHESFDYEGVVAELPTVRARFDQLGMVLFSAKTSYLEAAALKGLRRDAEARAVLSALKDCPAVAADQRLRSMVLTTTAELEGRRGRFGEARANIEAARRILPRPTDPIASAYLHGVDGELLRDQGMFAPAAEAYRMAIAIDTAWGFHSQAAYLRVVLAEMLLAAGRESEATAEIVLALPAIDNYGMVREGIAAMGLLRESIRRKKADPYALREVRMELDRAGKRRSQ